jgi:hypothetical protein
MVYQGGVTMKPQTINELITIIKRKAFEPDNLVDIWKFYSSRGISESNLYKDINNLAKEKYVTTGALKKHLYDKYVYPSVKELEDRLK